MENTIQSFIEAARKVYYLVMFALYFLSSMPTKQIVALAACLVVRKSNDSELSLNAGHFDS